MAHSVVAKGNIPIIARQGDKIPLGWASLAGHTKDGKSTGDANETLYGSMAAIGGPKSSAINILVNIIFDELQKLPLEARLVTNTRRHVVRKLAPTSIPSNPIFSCPRMKLGLK